ncbi:MAG: amidohydrolase family protein [Gemmatimonadaceae bacterium]
MPAGPAGDSDSYPRNPQSAKRSPRFAITDVHIHVQPFDELKPGALDVMRKGAGDRFEFLMALMGDPELLLGVMDDDGIDRVGMVNYPSPDVMGFTEATNDFAARYAEADRRRLLPYGGVDPLTTTNATRSVEHLLEIGSRVLKIHPCHMRVAANAYTSGLTALSDIYRLCEARGLPVMIHTGTSIFPGARSKYGNPMEIDDVAIDFPDLRIIMAHGGRPLYMKEAFFILRRHPNVWLDLSGIPPKRLLEYFPRLSELSRRVLWGTDWPSPGVDRMRTNVDQFLALTLGESLERAVLETNPLAILP